MRPRLLPKALVYAPSQDAGYPEGIVPAQLELCVIIPTKGRPLDLELAVESILRQSVLPDQLIIVDQSQSDDGRKNVERLFAKARSPAPEKIHLCYLRDATISGGATARNRGMEMAQGDIWLFLDDDVSLEADFLKEILGVYQQSPYVCGVSGIISNYEPPSWIFRLWASLFVRGTFHDERQPIYWRANHLRNSEPIVVTKLGGGLMSFRADAVRGYRFDENLRGVSDGEDVDFCMRLGQHAVLVIAPRARLAHRASSAGRDLGHWLRRSVRATHYLHRKNWNDGVENQLCFAWLNVGYVVVAAWAATRRRSLEPWHALWMGLQDAKVACRR